MTETTRFIFDRKAAIEFLVARDGYKCQFPDCELPFDEGRHVLTLDHIFPQAECKKAGWTHEEIWDYSNLQLMGKSCNARKGHYLYDEDGNLQLPERTPRSVKAERVPVCETCASGRLLLWDETCDVCGSGPQPATAPKHLQRTPKECDHSTYHCWACFIGDIPRKSALDRIIGGP